MKYATTATCPTVYNTIYDKVIRGVIFVAVFFHDINVHIKIE